MRPTYAPRESCKVKVHFRPSRVREPRHSGSVFKAKSAASNRIVRRLLVLSVDARAIIVEAHPFFAEMPPQFERLTPSPNQKVIWKKIKALYTG